MEQRQHQNPDPLETEGSATRKSEPENQHRHSALSYWIGIIDRMHSSRRKMGKGCATRPLGRERCRTKMRNTRILEFRTAQPGSTGLLYLGLAGCPTLYFSLRSL